MKAERLLKERFVYDDGAILEMVVWRLAVPLPGSSHCYKYRLYYGRGGRRLVGCDNERSKGDHRHAGTAELPYVFRGVEALVRDFLADVEQRRVRQ